MPLLLACDNCIQGAPSRYYGYIALSLLLSVLVAAGVWMVSRRLPPGAGRKAMYGATVCFLLSAPAGLILITSEPKGAGGGCGSALKASMLRGVPDDSALDKRQVTCKHSGERWVRAGAVAGTVAILAGGVLVAIATVHLRHAAPVRARAA